MTETSKEPTVNETLTVNIVTGAARPTLEDVLPFVGTIPDLISPLVNMPKYRERQVNIFSYLKPELSHAIQKTIQNPWAKVTFTQVEGDEDERRAKAKEVAQNLLKPDEFLIVFPREICAFPRDIQSFAEHEIASITSLRLQQAPPTLTGGPNID
jgi:hypothetical protein